jgi:hypothetical protein
MKVKETIINCILFIITGVMLFMLQKKREK